MNPTNLLGTVSAVLAAVVGLMTQLLSCSSTGDLAATCTSNILPAQWLGIAGIVFGILTLLLKAVRPGGFIHSMFGATAVVVPEAKSGPGVVTKSQVASK